jgi:hypothetical protein
VSSVVIAAPSGKPPAVVRTKLFEFGPLPGGGFGRFALKAKTYGSFATLASLLVLLEALGAARKLK